MNLSRRAHRVVTATLVFAATMIAALVIWDIGWALPLPLGVAGHEGSTVIVGLNGLRLLRVAAWRPAQASAATPAAARTPHDPEGWPGSSISAVAPSTRCGTDAGQPGAPPVRASRRPRPVRFPVTVRQPGVPAPAASSGTISTLNKPVQLRADDKVASGPLVNLRCNSTEDARSR